MTIDWMLFGMLLVGSVMGAIFVIPYAFEINRDRLTNAPMSMPKLVALSIVQSTVMFGVVIFLGLNASDAVGLSIASDVSHFPLAVVVGILSSILLLMFEYGVFRAYLPESMKSAEKQMALWKRFGACFYGGISEEVLLRLFVMSVVAWFLLMVLNVAESLAYPIAILVATVLFGLGHLPATASMTRLTPMIIVRAILLNGIFGIACGILFWQYGLVAAMVAHFTGDIVLHVLMPMFGKSKA